MGGDNPVVHAAEWVGEQLVKPVNEVINYAATEAVAAGTGYAKRKIDEALNHATGTNQTETTVVTNPETGTVRLKKRGTRVEPVIVPDVLTNRTYVGTDLLQQAENRLSNVRVKLGGRAYPDLIGPFLSNLIGRATVTTQHAGRILVSENTRSVHCQNFRHNWHNTNALTPYTADEWPHSSRVMRPFNQNINVCPGAVNSTTQAQETVNSQMYQEMGSGVSYWAPLNCADYEDMSWNLNALKLTNTNSTEADKRFASNATLQVQEDHAATSYIFQNNLMGISAVGNPADTFGVPTQPDQPSVPVNQDTFKYNMVFNYGSITYKFCNRGGGGAKVEMILYKKKKNHTGVNTFVNTGENQNQFYPLPDIAEPIKAGFYKKAYGNPGTDDLQASNPDGDFCYTKPYCPLLPQTRTIQQGELPFNEVSRQTFILPSGGKRTVEFQLPGEVYDPTVEHDHPVDNMNNLYYLSKLGYTLVIGVSGVLTPARYNKGPTMTHDNVTILGEMHGYANVQYTMEYKERISGCQYKTYNRKNVSVKALLDVEPFTPAPSNPDDPPAQQHANVHRTPCVMVPNATAVNVTTSENLLNQTRK